jgi:zinc transporter ZupT
MFRTPLRSLPPVLCSGNAIPGIGEFDQQYLKAAEAVESKMHAEDLRSLSLADISILVIALCFHAIFEGLAIGLSGSAKDAWKTTGTIVIHKVSCTKSGWAV